MSSDARPTQPLQKHSTEQAEQVEAADAWSMKRRRIDGRSSARNPFIDDEAEDNEDEDGEDESEPADFIDNGGIRESEGDPIRALERQLARDLGGNENEGGDGGNAFLTALEERYVHNTSNPVPATLDKSASDEYSTRAPHAGDWPLCVVRVKIGNEAVMVYQLYERSLAGMASPHTTPKSIFFKRNFPGRVFVEADTKDTVSQLCRGIDEIKWSRITVVSHTTGIEHLSSPPNMFVPKPGTWVRLNDPAFLGDLAYVLAASPNNDDIKVVTFPRFTYRRGLDTSEARLQRGCKLERLIFSPTTANELDLKNPVDHVYDQDGQVTGYKYLGMTFDVSRYLIMSTQDYFLAKAQPSQSEIQHYSWCISIPLLALARAGRQLEWAALSTGDRVIFTASSLKGSIGRIREIGPSSAHVELLDQSLEAVEVPWTELRCHLLVGDVVQLKSGAPGQLTGVKGWVLSADEGANAATIFLVRNKTEVTVKLSDVELTTLDFDFKQEIPRGTKSFMETNIYAKYVGDKVMAVTGPYKQYVGRITSVNFKGMATVEFEAKVINANKVEEMDIRTLMFIIEGEEYLFKIDNLVEGIELVPTPVHIPGFSRPAPEAPHSQTPPPDSTVNVDPAGTPWVPDEQDLVELRPEIPPTHWIPRVLKLLGSCTRIWLRITDTTRFEGGRYTNAIGALINVEGNLCEMVLKNHGSLRIKVPYIYMENLPPSKEIIWHNCINIEDGPHFGDRHYLLEYAPDFCGVGGSGPAKYRVKKRLRTCKLVAFS